MKQITLQNMKIRNFKGIKGYDLSPDGHSISVFGENGTGKTTLYDAFLWCLFGKDSTGSSDTKFDWKPLNKKNEEVHHLETEVSVLLSVDGQEKEFSRMISEDWRRTRGSIQENFHGHTTDYKVDGISIKKKEYTDILEKTISDGTFKMLTNVDYFPEKLDWKQRREVLIDMVGDVSDQDVIDSTKDLKDVPVILDGKSVEDRLKQIKQRKTKINQDISSLPQRIDEVDRSIPDLSNLDQDKLDVELEAIAEKIQAKEEEIASFSNGGRITNLRSSLQTKTADLQTARSEYQLKQNDAVEGLQEKKQELFEKAMDANNVVRDEESKEQSIKKEIESTKKESESIMSQLAELRDNFKKIKDETYPDFDDHEDTCVLCGQGYPKEKQAEMKESHMKEKADFNSNKAAKLEAINAKGKELKVKKDSLEEEIHEKEEALTVKSDMHKLIKERDDFKKEHETIKQQIEDIKSQSKPFEDTAMYGSINAQIEKLKLDIKSLQESVEEQMQEKRDELNELKTRREAIQDELYQFKQAEKQEARKKELIEEEGMLGLEYGSLEQQLQILEEFIRTKVNLLTETINDKFKIVKFKLFSTNINGGLEEVCEPTVNGANYSTGLNNAARINAGLDIINTLMDHYQIKVPIFIDNAESINDILDIDTQQITLSVSKHKTLRVEEV